MQKSLSPPLSKLYAYLFFEAWELYQEHDIMGLVDASLNENFIVNEASIYIRIAFLCTQDNPKSRPSMATIVNMLKGDTDVDEMKISKLGLLSELSRTYRTTPNESFLISQRNNVLWHHNFHFHIR